MIRLLSILALSALLAASNLASNPAPAQDSNKDANAIHVMEPWTRAVPPVAKATAAYGLFHNHTKRARTLVGASSPAFDKVEMHSSYTENGIASMRQFHEIEVPANGTVSFEPNGRHLMLIGRKEAADISGSVEIEFEYADGSRAMVTFPVKKTGPDHTDHKHEHTQSH